MKKLFENWRKSLNEAAYEPGRAVSGIDQEIEREDALSYQHVRDTFKSDLQDVGMDWLMDDPNEDMYSVLDQLQRDSDSPDEFADNIKQWLNNQDPAQIGYTNLGDDVLNEGIENITPENVQIAADALRQVATNFAPAIIIPAIMMIYQEYKDKKKADK